MADIAILMCPAPKHFLVFHLYLHAHLQFEILLKSSKFSPDHFSPFPALSPYFTGVRFLVLMQFTELP